MPRGQRPTSMVRRCGRCEHIVSTSSDKILAQLTVAGGRSVDFVNEVCSGHLVLPEGLSDAVIREFLEGGGDELVRHGVDTQEQKLDLLTAINRDREVVQESRKLTRVQPIQEDLECQWLFVFKNDLVSSKLLKSWVVDSRVEESRIFAQKSFVNKVNLAFLPLPYHDLDQSLSKKPVRLSA